MLSPTTLTNLPPHHHQTTDAQHSALAGAPWRRLVVMGDSVAVGVGDPTPGYRDQPWADQLAEALSWHHEAFAYRNLGVRGLRAGEILSTQLAPAVEFRPDLAVVSAGGNDLLGRRFDTVMVEDQVEGIVATLAATGSTVVTFSLFDLSATPFVPDEMRAGLRSRLEQHAEINERLTRRYDGVFVDFLSDPATGDPALYSSDQLHANRRGHALVLAGMVRELGAALGDSAGREDEHVA